MDTGIYVALSKEIGTLRDMDVTANNIANMNTTGFQSEDLLFTDFLSSTTPQENNVAFTEDVATYRHLEQGTLQQTGAPLDAAIQGQGYFVVQTPLGTRYTRNGNFKISGNGLLVTSEGYPVLDSSNLPVSFDTADRVISIREDGTINVDNADRSTLQIVQFDNQQLLHRVGNTMYSSDVAPKPAQNYQVASGMLERSNVNPYTQVTHMMYLSRSIAGTINYIKNIYQLEEQASNTLAKIYT